jgi:hypothetical protein
MPPTRNNHRAISVRVYVALIVRGGAVASRIRRISRGAY